MGSLYNIQEELIFLLEEIEEEALENGEVSEELTNKLLIKDEELQVKGCNIVKFLNILENEKSLIDKEKKRIDSIKKSNQRKIDRLSYALLNATLNLGHQDKPTPSQLKSGKEGTKRLKLSDNEGFLVNLSTRQTDDLIIEEDVLNSKYKNLEFKFSKEKYEIIKEILKESDISPSDLNFILSTLVPKSSSEEVNKSLIKSDLKEGVEIEGVKKVNKISLSIS